MAVSVTRMVGFVGAGTVNESDLADDLATTVAMLVRYLWHLRHTDEAGTVTAITATKTTDPEAGDVWTWADPRPCDPIDLVPLEVLDRATMQVAADLFQRRQAPAGIVNTQFGGDDGITAQPARLDRDPLIPAYRLLARWTVPL